MDFVSSTKWLTTCESNQSNSSISNDYYPTLPEFLFLFVMFITWKKYMNLLFNGISVLCISMHQYGDNILLPVTTQNQKYQIFFIIFFFGGGHVVSIVTRTHSSTFRILLVPGPLIYSNPIYWPIVNINS